MTLEEQDISEIQRALRRKPTRGVWCAVGSWVENGRDDLKDICDCGFGGSLDGEGKAQAWIDAQYIAEVDPARIARLIKQLKAARAELKKLRAGQAARPNPMDWLQRWANDDDFAADTQWHRGYDEARRVVRCHLSNYAGMIKQDNASATR